MRGMIPLHQPNAANLVEFNKEIFRGRRLRWIRQLPGIKLECVSLGFDHSCSSGL